MASETLPLLDPKNAVPAGPAPKAGRGARAAGKPTSASPHRGTAKAPAAVRKARAVAEPKEPFAGALPLEREPAPIVLVATPAPRAEEWSPGLLETVRRTIAKDLDDDQFTVFMHVVNRTGLDPLARQIYPVVRNVKQKKNVNGQWTERWVPVMTIQTGIDGFRLIADRTGRYAPGRAPTFTHANNGSLHSATACVKKQTKDGTWHEVEATAFYSEFEQSFENKPTKFWKDMPHNQLAKCAEALALRKAFPARLSNIYTDDEMGQADNGIAGAPLPARGTQVQDIHDMLTAERRAQDAAAEGPVIALDRGVAAEAPGSQSGVSPAVPAPKSPEPPASRGSAAASPATTRTDGTTAAAGMVTTIRKNAERAGLYNAQEQHVDLPEEICSQVGLTTGGYTPQSLAAMVNAGEIAKALYSFAAARAARK